MRSPKQENRQKSWRNDRGIAKGPVLLLFAALLIVGIASFQFMQSRSVDHAQSDRQTGQLDKHKNPAAGKEERPGKTDKRAAADKPHNDSGVKAAISAKDDILTGEHSGASSSGAVTESSNIAATAPKQQTGQRPGNDSLTHVPAVPKQHVNSNAAANGSAPVRKPGSTAGTAAAQTAQQETFDQMIARARKSLFTIYNVQDYIADEYNILQGSTFLYNNKGMLVTNGHVVEGAKTVSVVAADGKKYTGSVIGFSYKPDVALIHVPKLAGKTPFPIDSKKYSVNSQVAAIANHLPVTMTTGKIIEKDLNMKTDPDDPYYYPNMYVVTSATPPGFSGGPLISKTNKKIIGINSLHSLTEDNIGYSMPIKEAEKLLKKWSEKPMTEKQIAALYKDPNANDKTTAKKITIKKDALSDKEKKELQKAVPDKKASAAKVKQPAAAEDDELQKTETSEPEADVQAVETDRPDATKTDIDTSDSGNAAAAEQPADPQSDDSQPAAEDETTAPEMEQTEPAEAESVEEPISPAPVESNESQQKIEQKAADDTTASSEVE